MAGIGPHATAPHDMNDGVVNHKDHPDDWAEREEEIVEGQANRGADDVGRGTDQGRGPAHVAGEDFSEEKRVGPDVKLGTDDEGHGHEARS
jgi:hypothetical protein